MRVYGLTPAAQLDLTSIWDYTQEHWDARQTETYITTIKIAIERVADNPDQGRSCDEIRDGYRRYSVGSLAVFYLESADGVDVVRILHQRMEPGRHL